MLLELLKEKFVNNVTLFFQFMTDRQQFCFEVVISNFVIKEIPIFLSIWLVLSLG